MAEEDFRIAKFITLERDEIMARWQKLAESDQMIARKTPQPILLNDLPTILEGFAEQLSLPRSQRTVPTQSLSKRHGALRARSTQFDLINVLREYTLLRQVLCEVLEERHGLSKAMLEGIVEIIEASKHDAATAFMEERITEEQWKSKIAEDTKEKYRAQAQELEQKAKLQEQFLAAMSHDIRNPLGAIRMSTDLILQEVEIPDDLQKIADLLRRNIDYTESLLNDLLDLNKLRSGTQPDLTVEPSDLVALAENAVADLGHDLHETVRLTGDQTVQGYWDVTQLRRVLDNLIKNALKFRSDESTVTVRIEAGKPTTHLSVHNYGDPIPPKQREAIFEPFQRRSQDEGVEGWGVGLAVVKTVTEAHGGSVRVESSADHGTTFHVELPTDARETPS